MSLSSSLILKTEHRILHMLGKWSNTGHFCLRQTLVLNLAVYPRLAWNLAVLLPTSALLQLQVYCHSSGVRISSQVPSSMVVVIPEFSSQISIFGVCIWYISPSASWMLWTRILSLDFSCSMWMMQYSRILFIDVGSKSPWSVGCWPAPSLNSYLVFLPLFSFKFTLHRTYGVNLIFRSSSKPWYTLPNT